VSLDIIEHVVLASWHSVVLVSYFIDDVQTMLAQLRVYLFLLRLPSDELGSIMSLVIRIIFCDQIVQESKEPEIVL